MNTFTFKNHQDVRFFGEKSLLEQRKQGLLCSRRCPAATILEAHDRFKIWARDAEISVVSGFHSPVEKECLRLLLAGRAGIIFCPAREIEHLRIRAEWKPALEAGRMLILSPFQTRQPDAPTCDRRNRLVADMADHLYIPYAGSSGLLAEISAHIQNKRNPDA
jgi:hypothetical protein